MANFGWGYLRRYGSTSSPRAAINRYCLEFVEGYERKYYFKTTNELNDMGKLIEFYFFFPVSLTKKSMTRATTVRAAQKRNGAPP
jgi:hypothetical protein